MQKILLSLMLLCIGTFVKAQSDSTLQQYVGKYSFSGDSPVKEIGVVIENGVLTATSAMGNAELKKTDTKDMFEIVGFGGMATFRRNEEGKVIGVTLDVQGMILEGSRQEGIYIIRYSFSTVLVF
jgi:hypothetical protein